MPFSTVPLSLASTSTAPSTLPMHGAAQTANAPPRSAPEPRRARAGEQPRRQHALRHGQQADEREPEHDEDEAGDLRAGLRRERRSRSPRPPAPSTTKTTVKPKMNGRLETTTRRTVPRSPSRPASTLESAAR